MPALAPALGSRPAARVSSRRAAAPRPARRAGAVRVVAGNANENGIFAPIVRVVKEAVGVKRFNQIRGKAIALHSQVITEFCKSVGADGKTRQQLILKAKKNGGLLGFLA